MPEINAQRPPVQPNRPPAPTPVVQNLNNVTRRMVANQFAQVNNDKPPVYNFQSSDYNNPTPQQLAQALCDTINGYNTYFATYGVKDDNYNNMVAYVDMLKNTLAALGYSNTCTPVDKDGRGNIAVLSTVKKDCNQQAQAICKINNFLSTTKYPFVNAALRSYYQNLINQFKADIKSQGCMLNEQSCSAYKPSSSVNSNSGVSTSSGLPTMIKYLIGIAIILFITVFIVRIKQTS